MKTVYMVMVIKKGMTVSVLGNETDLSFAEAGWIGACPVFDTMAKALEYCEGKYEVLELRIAK